MSSVISKNAKSSESDEIDISRIIGELIDHRKLIVFVTAIITIFAVIYAVFSTPVYQADALIQIEQKQGNAILNSLSQVLPDDQPQSAPEIALLQSRMILGKTVDDLNLQIVVNEDFFPVFGRGFARITGKKPGRLDVTRLYMPKTDGDDPEIKLNVINAETFSLDIDGEKVEGKVGTLIEKSGITLMVSGIDALPGTSFKISYQTKLEAINNLLKTFTVADQGKDTGMLNLALVGSDPDKINVILNSISQNYLAQNISRQSAQDAKSLDFLSKQLPQVRSDLDVSEDKLNQYRKQKDSVDLSLEAKSTLDQIVNIDNQLNELTFREADISQLYTKSHPSYKALMEKQVTLQQEKNRLNKKVSSMPATQQEVLRLSRDVESGRAVFMQLLNRQQELNIAKSSAIGNVRIIDEALTEPKPIKPRKILVVLGGGILGLILSVGIVLLFVFLRRGIESPDELEELGINVYASVPISESLKNKTKRGESKHSVSKIKNDGLLAIENPADLAIEAIRGLRTSLHFAMMEAKNNILMISGASPDAGKTFISSNLAAVIAQGGKKVLLIDADMRKGYTHKIFDLTANGGLSDVLAGQLSPTEGIKKISSAEFDFLPRGQVPPNPAELLMHKRMQDLLVWASENYDLVIVDTPPILAVTDATIIGRYVGTTLLVARFEKNSAKEISVSIKRCEQSGVDIKGCILNGVIRKASNYYKYGYAYYGYSYEDKKK